MAQGINPRNLPGRLADLVRVPIPYVLEVHVNGRLYQGLAVTLPNVPESVRRTVPGATTIEYTLGQVPIREHRPNVFQLIEFTGRSGLDPRAGYTSTGNVFFKPGPEILKEFDIFLANAQQLAYDKSGYVLQEDGRRGVGAVKLILRMLTEDQHLEVEVDTWQWSRSAERTRHSYEWVVSLKAYAPAKREVPTNLFSPLDEWAKSAADAIGQANAVGALLDNAIRNTRADLDALRAPLTELRYTTLLAQNIVASTRALARFPQDVLSDLAYVAEGLAEAWHDAEVGVREFSLVGDFGERLERIGWLVEDTARDTTTIAGVRGAGPSARGASGRNQAVTALTLRIGQAALPLAEPARTSQPYQLRPGDTLRTIAERVYGDAERWIEIARFNGWVDAHRDASGRPARPGDTILLPGVVAQASAEGADDPSDLLGCDFYIDPTTGDLEVADGDFRMVRGFDNLLQALRHRLKTVQGEASLFPGYGIPLVPGDPSPRNTGYLVAHLTDQLLSDPRVQAVRDMSILVEGDQASVEFTVIPYTGAQLAIVAPFSRRG